MDQAVTGLQRRLEQHLDELPVLPGILTELMALDREDEQYFERLLELIEREPNFSARLLAASNSALRGGQDPITTLRGAVARLGSSGAANLMLGFSVLRVFVPRDAWEQSLWRHAVTVAIGARELAPRCRGEEVLPDQAYAAGLLHDVGRFVLFQEAPEELRRVDEGGWADPEGLLEAEREICGLTHSELGALACAKWKLPESLVEVVRHHHGGLPEDPALVPLVQLIQFADLALFPSAVPGTPGMDQADDETLQSRVHAHLPDFLPLTLAQLRGLIAEVQRDAGDVLAALGV